jgi:hypothetical protein
VGKPETQISRRTAKFFRLDFNILCGEDTLSGFDHFVATVAWKSRCSLTPVLRRAASGAVYSEGGAASTTAQTGCERATCCVLRDQQVFNVADLSVAQHPHPYGEIKVDGYQRADTDT